MTVCNKQCYILHVNNIDCIQHLERGGKVYIDKDKLKGLMEERANGGYRKFARMLGLDVAHLYRVLNSNSMAGPKFLGRLKKYCDENGLNFEEYIFLDDPLHAVNGSEEGSETVGSS